MKTRKGFFIQTEKYERIRIQRKSKQKLLKSFCDRCGKEVEWLEFGEVLAITNMKKEELKTLIAEGIFDFYLTDEGRLLICKESLFNKEQ